MLVLLLVCIVSLGVRSLYAIVGCALSARGSSLKAASLATTPVVHRVLCRQKTLRAVRSPPRRPNVEGPFSLCCASLCPLTPLAMLCLICHALPLHEFPRCVVLRIAVLCFGSLCCASDRCAGVGSLCSGSLCCAWQRWAALGSAFALIGATYVGRALLDDKTLAG